MTRNILIIFSLVTCFSLSQNLSAMKKSITMNKDSKETNDHCCEAACVLVPAATFCTLGLCTVLAHENDHEEVELPSQLATNFFEQLTACTFGGALLGEMVYKGCQCCKDKQH